MAKQLNIGLRVTANTEQAKQQLESLKQQLNQLGTLSSIPSTKSITNDLMNASTAAYKLKIALEEATDVNTGKLNLTTFNKSLKNNNLSLSELRTQLNKLGPEGSKAFLNLANSIQKADAPLVNLSAGLKEMMNTLSNTVRWQIASSAVHAIVGGIQSAYRYAQDLDESLNNIRIVSGLSSEEMAKFAVEANKAANALSSTTKKYTDAALIFYQQGLGTEDVKERTDATIKMANVTGEAVDEVSSYMTAVWNNFNKDGTQSVEHYGDIMTKLGAETAASTAEIAGGLEKFAAVADTIGLSFEYATSSITTIVDKTRQSEDVVGTALKTIFSRIQGLQQGETLDDGTNLTKYSQALANVGVQIKDSAGNLKDMDEILNNIGQAWQNISRDQKVALAQTVAGVRQYTQFMALFDNWDSMQENLQRAYDAEGTLSEQADIYAESWEGARKRVQSALEAIYDDLIDEDFFIDILNGIENILSFVDKLIDSAGGLKGVLFAISTILLKTFNQQIAQKMRDISTSISDIGVQVYNKRLNRNQNLTEDEKKSKRKQTSGERLKEEAIVQVEQQAKESKDKKDYASANVYSKIGNLQKELINNSQRMSEEEKKITQELISRQEIYGQNLLAAKENLSIVIEEVQQEIARNSVRINNSGDSEAKEIQKKINKYSELAKKLNETNEVYKLWNNTEKNSKERKKTGKIKNKLINELEEEFKINKEVIREALKKDNILKILDQAYEDIITDLDKYTTSESNNSRTAQQNARILEDEVLRITDIADAQQKVTRQTKLFNQAFEHVQGTFKNIKGVLVDNKNEIVNLANGLSQFAMGISSLSSLVDTLNSAMDDGHLSFSEFSSALMSATMGFPMVVNGAKQMFEAYQDMIQGSKAYKTALKTETVEKEISEGFLKKNIFSKTADTIITTIQEKVLKKYNITLTNTNRLQMKAAIVIALTIAAIALLVAAVKGLINWWNKDAIALKEAKQATEDAKASFEEARNAYDDLKSSIEDYESSLDAINKLTKGTTEWKEAIQKANEQVLELLDKYPELVNYITKNENGLLEISEEGKDALLRSQSAKVQNTARTYYAAQINENKAQTNNDITQFVRTTDTVEGNDKERSIINSLQQQYAEQGSAALANNAETLAKQYNITINSAQRLLDKGINELIISLNANTIANDLLSEQMASSALEQNLVGYEDSNFKNPLNKYLSTMSEAGKQAYITGSSEVDQMSNDQLAEAYAAKMGIDEANIVDRGGGKMKVIDAQGNETQVKKSDMRKALYQDAAYYTAMEDTSKFANSLGDINKQIENVINPEEFGEDISSKLINGLTSAIGEGNFSDFINSLTQEEFDAINSAMSSGDLQNSINTLFENNKEYYRSIGINSAKEFMDAYNEAKGTYDEDEASRQAEIQQKESFQNEVDSLASSLDVDSDAVEGYVEQLQELYPQLENNTQATMDMAKANIKFSKGFDSLVSALSDNEEVLKDLDSTSWETQKALASVGNAYEEMTGVKVSNDFIAEHLEEIKKLADGDMTVLDELGEAAARDYVAHLEIPDEDISKFQGVLDQLANQGKDLEISAEINLKDANYLNTLNEMLEAGTVTADQVKTAFNSMGYSPDIHYKEADGPETTTTYDFQGSGLLSFLKGSMTSVSTSKVQVPVINGVAKISTPKSLGSSINKNQTTSAKKKDSGGDKKEKDRYHVIEKQISSLEKEYDRIAQARERAWGGNQLKYIDQEIEKTDQLIKAQKKYIAEIKSNLLSDRTKMNAYGAKYDKNGNITNYNKLFDKYGQDDEFEKRLAQYEETVDLWNEANDQLKEYKNQIQDLKYQKITTKVEIKIELNEDENKIADYFINKLSDNIYKVAEAIQYLNQKIENSKENLDTYGNEFNDLQKAYKKGEISQTDYKEGLEESLDGILDNLEALKSLDDEMMNYYGNTIDLAKQELDGYTTQLEHATKKLQHFQKVQSLSGQGKNYDTELKLINAQMKTTKNSFDVAKQWYDNRLQDVKDFKEALAKVDKVANPKEYELIETQLKKAQEAAAEAYDEMASYREEYLELGQQLWQTNIEKIKDAADKALSDGIGLTNMIDSMKNISTVADEYLTKTNQLYETNKMLNTLEADKNKTSNKAAKQRLDNFSKEIKSAQEQNKLSNLELEILQAKYKQLQAQIALEEAQNAKSTVRLSRDNEGNYGYIYTADQDKVGAAQQELADAENDLYNIRLNAFNSYSEKAIQAKQELVNKLAEIAADETLTEEEKYAQMERAQQEYNDIVTTYLDLLNIAQLEDTRIQKDAWSATYYQEISDATNWKTTVEGLMSDFKKNDEEYHKAIDGMVAITKEGYDKLDDAIDDVVTSSDTLATTVKDKVIPVIEDEIEKVKTSTRKYGKQRDAIDKVVKEYEKLTTKINNALQALKDYHAEQERKVVIPATKKITNPTSDITNGSDGTKNKVDATPSSKNFPDISKKGDTDSTKAQYYVFSGGVYNAISKELNPLRKAIKERFPTLHGNQLDKKYQQITKITLTDIGLKGYKNYKHIGFDTGGYTGKWGPEGKLAVLHEKELVLNKEDTSNLLKIIEIVRNAIDNNISTAGFGLLRAAGISTNNETLEQNVTITAEFPNATDHNEIEQAFDSLINRAAQFANRKK